MGSQVNLPGWLYRLFYTNRMSYDINIQNVFMHGIEWVALSIFSVKPTSRPRNINISLKFMQTLFYTIFLLLPALYHKKDKYR